MSEYQTIPPTPKIGGVLSLPDSPDPQDGKSRLGRGRLSSILAKVKGGTTRSTTPTPTPVTRYEPSPPAQFQRPRASSMTGKSRDGHKTKRPTHAMTPRFSEPTTTSHHRQGSGSQSTPWTPPKQISPVEAGKHQGPHTPKYMQAAVKSVALKEESVALSWPLVPMADRKHLKHPLLYYDVAFDPQEDMNLRDNRHIAFLNLPQADRELPVSTHCVITQMIIECPLVGSLVVERPEGLRCIDVFYAIHQKYQRPPKPNELPHQRDIPKLMPAFEQRCSDAPGLTEFNRRKGLIRADLLRGHRIFEGLRRSNGRWELLIDHWPRH